MIYLNLQCRVHKIKMKFSIYILTFSSCIFYSSIYGQFKYLEPYIPYENTPKETHPILEIKTWVHIMQYSKSDPKNITKDSLHYLKTQFKWINQMFSQLKPPTVANANGEKPYVKDARIRFITDTISFHIDENGWDRMKMQKVSNSNRWIDIIKIDADSNSITLDGVRDRFKPILDSLIIEGTLLNNGVYHPLKAVRSGYNTIIYLKESINVSEDSTGHISYFQKIDKNCHRDNWVNFTNEDKNYLHIFYTGASKDAPAFGCGPSPYFLNVSNIIMNTVPPFEVSTTTTPTRAALDAAIAAVAAGSTAAAAKTQIEYKDPNKIINANIPEATECMFTKDITIDTGISLLSGTINTPINGINYTISGSGFPTTGYIFAYFSKPIPSSSKTINAGEVIKITYVSANRAMFR